MRAEQCSAAKLEIRNFAAFGGKVPLQDQWIKSAAVYSRLLKHQVDGHEVNAIFKRSPEEPAAVRAGQHFANASTRAENLRVTPSTFYRSAAADVSA